MGSNNTSPRVIITAIISAVTSVLVALIGIAPFIYEKGKTSPLVQQEVCTISGEITSEEAEPMKNAEIYLIRATGSERMATTDDKGKFTFQQIPDASYWVIVRNIVSGSASRVLISKENDSGEIEVVKSILRYERCKDQ